MSRCVTKRRNCGPSAEISTPSSRAFAAIVGSVVDMQHDDVGRRLAAESCGEPAGAGMVVSEPLDVVGKRITSRCSEDPDLPHAGAVALAPHPRFGDAVGGRDEHRADWRAQAFRQAHRHRVERGGELAHRDAGGDVRVPQPRSVEMHRETDVAGQRDDGLELVGRLNSAAAEVVRVLDRDRLGRHEVRAAVGRDERPDRVDVDDPAVAGQVRKVMPANAAAAPSSARAMCASTSQTISSPGLASRRSPSWLPSDPRRHVQAGLVAEQLGDLRLERVDRRVLAVNVVPDLGLGHRGTHAPVSGA